jgi:hypothetical protein
MALARPPQADERAALRRLHDAFITDQPRGADGARRALVAACQALLASAEFRSLN